MAQAHGFTEHILSAFDALPDLPTAQPAGPLAPADAGRLLAATFAEEHGRIDHAYVPELKVWPKFVDGVWVENHTNLWDISDHLEINARALLAMANTPAQIKRAEALRNTSAAEGVERYTRAHPQIIVRNREFDRRSLLMGVPGGYIDEKGVLRDPDPGC